MAVYRRSEGFGEQARQVFQKLGSRNRATPRKRAGRSTRRRKSADAGSQLTLDMPE